MFEESGVLLQAAQGERSCTTDLPAGVVLEVDEVTEQLVLAS